MQRVNSSLKPTEAETKWRYFTRDEIVEDSQLRTKLLENARKIHEMLDDPTVDYKYIAKKCRELEIKSQYLNSCSDDETVIMRAEQMCTYCEYTDKHNEAIKFIEGYISLLRNKLYSPPTRVEIA
jgi:hypothetical protein